MFSVPSSFLCFFNRIIVMDRDNLYVLSNIFHLGDLESSVIELCFIFLTSLNI